MLSLGFPTPMTSSLLPFPKHKLFASSTPLSSHAQLTKRSRNDSNVYPSISIPKLRKAPPGSISNQHGYVEEDEDKYDHEEGRLEAKLPKGLRRELMPKHVGVIMDGNRRWAVKRGWRASLGHVAGQKALLGLVRLCANWGIKVLTVFAFSTENWCRLKEEVEFLLKFFEDTAIEDTPELERLGVRISVIGNRPMLSKSLREAITKAEETTKANSRIHLIIALNYSGKYDIVQACKGVAEKLKAGLIQSEAIVNERIFEQELETKHTEFPCPDLLIRTSGECRISNFMLWHLAYSELFFVENMFPDFGEAKFIEVLSSFQKRQRNK